MWDSSASATARTCSRRPAAPGDRRQPRSRHRPARRDRRCQMASARRPGPPGCAIRRAGDHCGGLAHPAARPYVAASGVRAPAGPVPDSARTRSRRQRVRPACSARRLVGGLARELDASLSGPR
jgi:hypothetical protein